MRLGEKVGIILPEGESERAGLGRRLQGGDVAAETSNPGYPFGFRCKTCGVCHEGVPLDFGSDLPEIVIPPEEFGRQVRTDADFCVVDEREFLIRGTASALLAVLLSEGAVA